MVLGTVAAAASAAAGAEAAAEGGVAGEIDGAFGPALMMRSRSNALGHLFKPMAVVGWSWPLTERWWLGPGITGVLSANEHYRFIGLFGRARGVLWQGSRLAWSGALSLGGARDADILHPDLHADRSVTVYGAIETDLRWRWGNGWQAGVALGWANLAIARLGLVVSRAWSTR